MKKTIFTLFILSTVLSSAFALTTLTPTDVVIGQPLPIVQNSAYGTYTFVWIIDENTQGTNMSPGTYLNVNAGVHIGSEGGNAKIATLGRKFVVLGETCAGYTIIQDCLNVIGNDVNRYAYYTVHPEGWTPFATPIDAYVASSTVNADFELLTGLNMQGTSHWIGDYLIRNFIGNLYGFFYDFKNWLIVLFIMGGVLYFVNRAFRFYRH